MSMSIISGTSAVNKFSDDGFMMKLASELLNKVRWRDELMYTICVNRQN